MHYQRFELLYCQTTSFLLECQTVFFFLNDCIVVDFMFIDVFTTFSVFIATFSEICWVSTPKCNQQSKLLQSSSHFQT